jgi:polar amino acid transport system substrate-binding protein
MTSRALHVVVALLSMTVACGAAGAASRKLVVAVVEDAPPFSYQTPDGTWEGLAIELWHTVAQRLEVEYELQPANRTVVIDRVARGSADFGIGPITMTSDSLARMQFTVPYYVTGLGIAVRETRGRAHILLDNALSVTFLEILGSLLAVLLVVGAFFWMFERRTNPEFGGRHVHGLGSGLWLAVVTMTTVGYGDKSPRTFGGRLIAAVWMFVSLLLVATFTGTVASLLTADRLGPAVLKPEDLYRVQVATVAGTGSATLLRAQQITAYRAATVGEALHMLVSGQVVAGALDRALLKYQLQRQPELPITLLPGSFFPEFYGFAMPLDSPYTKAANAAILSVVESPEWHRILFDYVGNHNEALAVHPTEPPRPK